jgi:hypothetical protein
MEATGYSRWFERLLAELDFEVWIGDPAEIQPIIPVSSTVLDELYPS